MEVPPVVIMILPDAPIFIPPPAVIPILFNILKLRCVVFKDDITLIVL